MTVNQRIMASTGVPVYLRIMNLVAANLNSTEPIRFGWIWYYPLNLGGSHWIPKLHPLKLGFAGFGQIL